MDYKIKIQMPDGKFYTRVGVPDYYVLSRALDKCEIKSFEISQIPYQQ